MFLLVNQKCMKSYILKLLTFLTTVISHQSRQTHNKNFTMFIGIVNRIIIVWGFFVLLLSIVLCVCVRVFKPTGDMLYFEVIKLFNCVSIFWNGIISSLKKIFKTLLLSFPLI